MKKLEELKKGDRIKIHFGSGVKKAKVLVNDIENNKLYLSVYLTSFAWFMGCHKEVFEYNSHNLENFNLLNNA